MGGEREPPPKVNRANLTAAGVALRGDLSPDLVDICVKIAAGARFGPGKSACAVGDGRPRAGTGSAANGFDRAVRSEPHATGAGSTPAVGDRQQEGDRDEFRLTAAGAER